MSNRTLIDDLCSGCCSPNKYCTLKEILARAPRDTRTMMQIKCIEKLKYERSKKDELDIGWDQAFRIWIDEGYAERFSRLFCDGIGLSELYSRVMNHSGQDVLVDNVPM